MLSHSSQDYGSLHDLSSNINIVNYNDEVDEEVDVSTNHTQYLAAHSEPEAIMGRRKLYALFPLLFFALIMGGLSYAIGRNFSNLYPGSGATHDSTTTVEYKEETLSRNSEQNSILEGGILSSSDCASHQNCKTAGLIGQCCPTRDGVFLSCC